MPQYIACSAIVYSEKSQKSNKTHVISHKIVLANIQALDQANTIEMEDGAQIIVIVPTFYNKYHQ